MNLKLLKNKSYKDLTQEEWDLLRKESVVNWCGWAGSNIKSRFSRFILKFALKRLRLIFIEASCDIHDFTYWQWLLAKFTEEELERIRSVSPRALEILNEDLRKKCDLWFFYAIMNDIRRSDRSVFLYTILALIFYYWVRNWWKDYFEYWK